MHKFEIVLRNDKKRFYDRFAIFIFILNGLAIGLFLYLQLHNSTQKIAGIIALILSVTAITTFFSTVKEKNKKTITIVATICISIYWIMIENWWMGIAAIVLLALYTISKEILKVFVSAEYIIYPSFPKRNIQWNELNNLVLKDDLLTIDFKNNKIIQQLTDKKASAVNEKEFNDFCSKQLNK